MININDTYNLAFKENLKVKVKLVHIDHNVYTPDDYWFTYVDKDGEKPIVHPDFGTKPYIKSEIVLPSGLIQLMLDRKVLVKD